MWGTLEALSESGLEEEGAQTEVGAAEEAAGVGEAPGQGPRCMWVQGTFAGWAIWRDGGHVAVREKTARSAWRPLSRLVLGEMCCSDRS